MADAVTLLKPHQALLDRIRRDVGVPPAHWAQLYAPLFENYARFVQQLPASEAYHHNDPGGLLRHGLEVVAHAMTQRIGKLLPVGEEAERLADAHDRWTYAVVTGALLHDVGKPVCDQRVVLYDHQNRKIGVWNPLKSPMDEQGVAYRTSFQVDRRYRLHEQIAPLFVYRLVPIPGLTWLFEDKDLMTAWMGLLSGDQDQGSILGEIIHQADGLSTAVDLTGSIERVAMVSPKGKPLFERLVVGLRFLIEEKQLPLNDNGSAGWVTKDDVWLVSKRILDALREHLTGEGQLGIPGQNHRLMDELQQRGFLTTTAENRAIWRVSVFQAGWPKAHELTVLRIPCAKLWPDPDHRPAVFEGTVQVLSSNEKEAATMSSSLDGVAEPTSVRQAITSEDIKPEVTLGMHQRGVIGLDPVQQERDAETRKEVTAQSVALEQENQLLLVPEADLQCEKLEGDANNVGMTFLSWLREGLTNKRFVLNASNARIHVVREGVFLVSPGIFRDFDQRRWSLVQKKFQQLKLHQKTAHRGENIHSYRVIGPRKKGAVIKGFLISDVAGVLPGISLPPPNDVLVRVSERAG